MDAKLRARHPDFDPTFRDRLQTLLAWRRDVRRFRRDALPPGTIERLIGIAYQSPSVGLSEPWRFVIVRIKRAALRSAPASRNAIKMRCANRSLIALRSMHG